MHRSVYVSIDLFTRLSIDLAIKSHCTYPLLCFKNRCLPELPLRCFPSSAYGCTMGVRDKTDAKRRRATRMGQKKHHHSSVPTTTLVTTVTCCRLESAARKDTRSESSHCATVACFGDKTDAESGRHTDGSEKRPSVQRSNVNIGNDKVTCCKIGSAVKAKTVGLVASGSSGAGYCHFLRILWCNSWMQKEGQPNTVVSLKSFDHVIANPQCKGKSQKDNVVLECDKHLPKSTMTMMQVLSSQYLFFPSNAFMASARSFNTLYGIAKAVISN